jgi:hypothetical protein
MLGWLATAAAAWRAEAAVSWRCSTHGSEWQLRPLSSSRGGLASPRDICTPTQGINCNGNDISRPWGTSAADCCAACKALTGCFAWTYDSTPSHKPQCNMKSHCPNPRNGTKWVVSGWVPAPPAPPPPPPAGSVFRLTVNTSSGALHQMEGFGGCFNEKGWDALSVLTATQRATVMAALFGPDGLRWGINRMPIGSSDFADSYYSLDDTVGDVSIKHLNLSRDNEKLLPFIKAAMAVNPSLRLWGSPWTAPTWLKDSAPQMPANEGCGSLSPNPKLRAAYALCELSCLAQCQRPLFPRSI